MGGRGRTGPGQGVVGIGAVTITSLTSGLLERGLSSKIFGAGWQEQVHILRNSSNRLAKMTLPCFYQRIVQFLAEALRGIPQRVKQCWLAQNSDRVLNVCVCA